MMPRNEYTRDWFDVFASSVPAEATRAECNFIESLLPTDERSVLDICCGRGRHAAELGNRGVRVSGFDRDAHATEQASRSCPQADIRIASIEHPPLYPRQFGLVCCLWQSFGFGSDQENEALFAWMLQQAAPSGAVLLDIYRPAFFRAHQEQRAGERAGVRFTEAKSVNNNRLTVQIDYEGRKARDLFDWRLYESDELDQAARRHGWCLDQLITRFDPARPPTDNDPRQQLVFRRASDQ